LDGVEEVEHDFTLKTDSARTSQSPKKIALKRERSRSKSEFEVQKPDSTYMNLFKLDAVHELDDDDVDDDEYLFNRTKSRSGTTLLINPVDLSNSRSSTPDEEIHGAGDASYESDSIQSRRLNPWANRKKRPIRPDWTRTESRPLQGKKGSSSSKDRQPSFDFDSLSSEDGDTTLTSPLQHDTEKEQGKKRSKSGVPARSDSITPPPEVDQKKLKEVEQMIARVLDRPGRAYGKDMDDEIAVDAMLKDDRLMADLDPDLRRAMRGASAGVLRKQLRQKEERDRELTARAQRSQSRQTASTSASHVSSNTIEISDSESDNGRKAAIRSSKRRETRNSARARNSSSPILVSVSTQKERILSPMRDLQTNTTESCDEDEESERGSTHEEQGTQEAQTQDEQDDRIQIVMKGGPQGSLQVHVKVRQSTLMETLLDHYMKVHRNDIPLNRTSKVRLRFDGDILKVSDTVGGIGIEDEEQLDVIW
jgi:hypothetical protein